MVNSVDIILVKSDPVTNEASIRAYPIITSLSKKYSIIVLGWNGEGTIKQEHNHDRVFKLFNVRAPYSYEPYGSIRFHSFLPIFWIWIFIRLCRNRPESIHACNLDSILPCYLYKIMFRKKLVFDVFDRYAMAYIPKDRNVFFRLLYSFVNYLEEYFAKRSDVLINNSDEILQTYRNKPKNCITIMNCSEDHAANLLKEI